MAAAPHLECSWEKDNYHHQHPYLGTGDLSFHRKRGSNFTLNQNMINKKSQHHQTFVLTPKVPDKLT